MALLPAIDQATFSAFVSIVLISLTMSGDNALVIGMAAHGLPERQRRWAVALAIFGAIAFRVVFAGLFAILLFRTELLAVRLVGGVVLIWIAWKLVVDPPHGDPGGEEQDAGGLAEAVFIILVADASMSLDNMLAVAAASNGMVWLIGFGLMISIPLLFLGATAISRVLDRFPWLVWVGGAVIAYVSGGLIAEEPLLIRWFHLPHELGGLALTRVGGLLASEAPTNEAEDHDARGNPVQNPSVEGSLLNDRQQVPQPMGSLRQARSGPLDGAGASAYRPVLRPGLPPPGCRGRPERPRRRDDAWRRAPEAVGRCLR